MDEIQKSIIDAIKIQVNEKIKDLQFDKTCYGKVVAIRDDICDVEIRGEIAQCKIRNGLQICENDIVLVRLINNDFSNKFVDAKLGTVGDDVAIELIGNLSLLLTTAKTNIVAAINEVFNKAGDVEDNLATHKAKIATSTQLGHVKVGQNLAIDSNGTLHAQASGGKKVARFVIGTSTAGWTKKDCDYLCDGTNDQEEIIQALNALPATGGEVVILDGTYNITASINIPKNNVSLRGNGSATILKRMYNSTDTDNGSTARGLITLNEKSGCKIQGLQIDGNKATYTAIYNYGIYLYSSSNNNTVTGNTCNNNDSGIRLYSSNNNTVTGNACNNNNYSGIDLSSSSDNTITGNTCNNNNNGIYLYSSSNNNTATGNTCNNNDYGICLYSSSNNNTATGNTCNNNYSGIRLYSSNNNTITCNTCNNSFYSGIDLSSSSDNTITGNTCNNNNNGICLYSSSNNNTATGNTCNNNYYGIDLSSSNNNTITCNTCNNSYIGIYLYPSSDNTVTGNTCNNNYYGICLYSSSNNNTVTGNACNNNNYSGIYLSSSNNNTITCNTCNNSNYGIRLYSSSNNTVTGNTCIRGTGQTSDYTSNQYTILLSGTDNNYNLISSNNCMGKAVVIEDGTGNSAWGNKYDSGNDLP